MRPYSCPKPLQWAGRAVASGVLLLAVGCVEESTVTLPANYNAVRNRSVRIDASKLVTKSGALVDVAVLGSKAVDYTAVCVGSNCGEYKAAVTDGSKVASLQGINGTAKTLVPSDPDNSPLFGTSVRSLYANWMRIPVGYGCKPLLQTLFPDRNKNPDDIANYNLEGMNELIAATKSANSLPVWTASYDIGSGGQGCDYSKGEPTGNGIQDPAKWAKVVRKIAAWYDFELPAQKKDEKTGDPLCRSEDPKVIKPWYCSHTLIAFEFFRDAFGAGGFKADVPADRAKWLAAYKAFATELRATFPLPANGVVKLIGPSITLKGLASVQDSASPARSPIYDFIDFVVSPANKPANAARLPLSHLSFEVEAGSPIEARQIVEAVAGYAAKAGLKAEVGVDGATGNEAMPIWVSDLRITQLPATVQALGDPKSAQFDLARLWTWRGGFFATTRMLWQGLVSEATLGQLVRLPTVDPDTAVDKIALAASSRASDFLWFGQDAFVNGTLKPSGWYGFWFHPDYLGGKQRVAVQHGPDALGMSGTTTSDPAQGIVVLATRSTCLNASGLPTDCVPAKDGAIDKNAYVTNGKRGVLRVMVVDNQVETLQGRENLEHNLRIQVDGLPADAKVAGYRWAWMDGTPPGTWSEFLYRELGIVDVSGGSLSFTRTVAVPSVHYLELYYN
jgi:hypothetical protein